MIDSTVITKIKAALLKGLLFTIALYVSLRVGLLISLIFWPLPQQLQGSYSESFYYREGGVPAWISLNSEEQYRSYTALEDSSDYLKKGIVLYEDRYFYFHPGFNPISIARALILNRSAGRVVSGGSTITMQLARLAEPKERTILNKLYELLRACQLETIYSKSEILELYLNSIPMGGNIQGVGAASFFYFKRAPRELTFAESSLLIGLSNSPELNRPDRAGSRALKQRAKVASRIAPEFEIDEEELERILSAPISEGRYSFEPQIIPLIERLQDRSLKRENRLTIDYSLQQMCLAVLRKELRRLESVNGAVIVVDNESREILAYVGSPFYESALSAVKFNAANILRSPGSTLKPFIFARALEEGMITPEKRLFDFPYDFNGYEPENFSNKYEGLVAADQALIRSLNIPAVYLSSRLGKGGIKEVFRRAGLRSLVGEIENEDLSIALGSYPMTLESMVILYSALANGGELKELRFFPKERESASVEILTKESSYVISEILAEVARPDLPNSWEFTMDKPKVAFKTGTSYGFVDAWSIGYTPSYTVGVWVGNLNNRFTRVLTGSDAAAPILFAITNELERRKDSWFERPQGVAKRKVCALSGLIPGPYCPQSIDDYYLKECSGTAVCDVHRRVIIDSKSRKVVPLEQIREDGEYEERIIEVWEEHVEHYLQGVGRKSSYYKLGDYKDIFSSELKIRSPQSSSTYVIDNSRALDDQRMALAAYGYPDSGSLYWYSGERLIGKTDPERPLYYLPENVKESLTVVDERGRSGKVEIKVEFIE